MKQVKCLHRHEVIERGIDALYKELGPIEARRFIAFTHPPRREDSVVRHQRWQASLNRDMFLKEIRTAYSGKQKKRTPAL